jgi:hypothetical protein
MKRLPRQSGQALLAVIIVVSLVLLLLLGLITHTQTAGKAAARQLIYQGQGVNAAEAGLTDALSWFRRQGKTVTAFKPIVDATTKPPTNDTEDPTIGIVRTYSVSVPGHLMGRYEVRIGDPKTGAGVLDVTARKGKVGFPAGTIWQLESVGYVFVQNDASQAFNVAPNQIISTQTVRTEIQKMSVTAPDSAALFAARCSNVTIGTKTKIQGGTGIGISCPSGTGSVINNGTVTGQAATIKTNSTAKFDMPGVFGVTQQELLGLADMTVTTIGDLPVTLPSMSLIVVSGNAPFTAQRPLVGSGVLVVLGNVTIPAGSNSSWSGVIYATGNVTIGQPTQVSGAIIAGSAAGVVNISSGADIAEVDYDPSIITQLNQQMAQYRFSRSRYWLGK